MSVPTASQTVDARPQKGGVSVAKSEKTTQDISCIRRKDACVYVYNIRHNNGYKDMESGVVSIHPDIVFKHTEHHIDECQAHLHARESP
jgi:hypothetical protein